MYLLYLDVARKVFKDESIHDLFFENKFFQKNILAAGV